MAGPRIGVTAARKGGELAAAFERRGARVMHGPTLGGDQPAGDAVLAADIDRLASRSPRWFAASTGTGMRVLDEAAARTGRHEALAGMLGRATAVARGAKAVGGLRRLGVAPAWVAPGELDSEVAAWLADHGRPGETVAVQLHGAGAHPYGSLAARGLAVETVNPYVSMPPTDPEPGLRLVRAVEAGELDVVTFTSPGAVHGLAALAEAAGISARVRAALSGPVRVAVVGPVTRASAEQEGYPPAIEPAAHRSGALLRAVMDWWNEGQRRTP